MTLSSTEHVYEAVTRLSREEGGRVLALLARRFGDLDLADEAVQDALVVAVAEWPTKGVPDDPAASLYIAARNGAIDRLRRAASVRRRLAESAHELTTEWEEEPDMIIDESTVGDEHLRLMLLCCHPALDRNTQVALTLRLVGGLSTDEIAAAFLVPEATLAQRIVRAKRKIREAGIPLSIPAALDERVDALLAVLYLVFNKGYLARGGSDDVTRVDLADELIRLTRVALTLLPGTPEIEGLLALELFHRARLEGRVAGGELVLLEKQDRTAWNLVAISEANALLAAALIRMRPDSYQLQALIAAKHANARTAADTDWPAVAGYYAQLAQMTSNPVVALNRAVAIAMANGPRAALPAREAFERALALATNPAEKRHLARRIAVIG